MLGAAEGFKTGQQILLLTDSKAAIKNPGEERKQGQGISSGYWKC